jgi:sugar fermentation stimulation protein A
VFFEWAEKSGYFGENAFIKPECTYKNSRFDFYIESDERKIFVEVKGVTLEKNGEVSFPDAPTERGIKHLLELSDAVKNGYTAYVFFIVQMTDVKHFEPSFERHPEFCKALKFAKENGVHVMSLDCKVTPNSLTARDFVKVVI